MEGRQFSVDILTLVAVASGQRFFSQTKMGLEGFVRGPVWWASRFFDPLVWSLLSNPVCVGSSFSFSCVLVFVTHLNVGSLPNARSCIWWAA